MMVQNINGINPINNVQNSRRTNGMERTSITDTSDSINVSDEAKEAARAYFLSQVAEETPDVRSDLVASVKEKIKRFFSNKHFHPYEFFDLVIKYVISTYKQKHNDKRIHIL